MTNQKSMVHYPKQKILDQSKVSTYKEQASRAKEMLIIMNKGIIENDKHYVKNLQ